MSFCPCRAFAAFGLLTVTSAFGAERALVEVSPFLPAPGFVTAPASGNETLEFAGVSTIQNQTMVSLFNRQEKRGRWIPVGCTIEGIEVVSYDANRDQVVIRSGGQLKVLSLRTPAKTASSGFSIPASDVAYATLLPTAVPKPALPTNANASELSAAMAATAQKKPMPLAQQQQETRMFVADMLDIGTQNRKAYEEAQKKAAAEKAAETTSPSNVAAPIAATRASGG